MQLHPCQLRLSSSRSFPSNATSIIWDTYHGQPMGWTEPRAHLLPLPVSLPVSLSLSLSLSVSHGKINLKKE